MTTVFSLVFWVFGKTIVSMVEVIFFDGQCPWCGGFVSWVARRDRSGRYCYAPLQGSYARGIVPREMLLRPRGDWEMCFWDGGVLWKGSSAALRVLSGLGFPWGLVAGLGFCVPRLLREVVYGWVASRRPMAEGLCFLPSAELRSRVLY